MDRQEAREILDARLAAFRGRSYADLARLIGAVDVAEVRGPSGTRYQVEIAVTWDSPREQRDIRVSGTVDDGRLPASLVPVGNAFLVAPDGMPEQPGQRGPGATAVVAIEHVQLAMPPGREADARAFYAGLLGIPEVAKPAALARRGGAWFEHGPVKIHLGVDADFRPARKAHPALLVRDLRAMAYRLREAGADVVEDPLEGWVRVYVTDPFGNRIELMEPT